MLIVGRHAESAQLGALAERARHGCGGLVVITGEAGIGKTTVAERASAAAGAAGMRTAWTGCAEPAPPLGLWRQTLGQVAPQAGDAALQPQLHRADRRRQCEAVVEVLRRAAAERPVHLTIDDLHVADQASLRLLEYAAAQVRSMPILIVATTRAPATPALRPHAVVLPLAGLDAVELGDVVAAATGVRPAPSTAESLRRHTLGNPLFARELALLLPGEDLARLDGPQPPPVPETVRAVLAQRLERLTPPARETVVTAAVAGDVVTADLLERVLPQPVAVQLLASLDEAARAGVLRETGHGRYTFSHPLVRATAYASLGLVRRTELHRRIADALAQAPAGPADVDLLAYHYLGAAAGGATGPAYGAAMAAAEQSLRLLAYEKAADYCQQALTVCGFDATAGDRVPALLGLGRAATAAGDLGRARTAYLEAAELARGRGDASALAAAALGLAPGEGFEVALSDREQVALLEEALAAVDADTSPGLWARVAARLSVALSLDSRPQRRASLSEQAVAVGRRSGEPGVLAAALAAHCDAIAGPADAERRLAASAEVIDLARSAADVHGELLGRRLRLVALLEIGDLAAADREVTAFAAAAALLRQPTYDWYPALWRGMRALYGGDLEGCARHIDEVRRIGAVADSANARLLATVQEMYLALARGRPDEALTLVASVPDTTADELGPQAQVFTAYLTAMDGRLDAAAGRLRGLSASALEALPRDSEWLPCLVQLVETAAATGDTALHRHACDLLEPFRDRWVVEGIGAVVRGPVARFLPGPAPTPDETAAADPAAASAAERAAGPAAAVFRREGDVWLIAYAGRTVRLRHAKGLSDLAELLGRPGREIPALDLASPGGAPSPAELDGASLHPPGDLGDLVDAQARAAYKRRLAELGEADDERSRREREALVEQLTSAYGLSGRPRRSGDPAERARTAVTARVRAAVDRIAAIHPELGRHLRHSLRTGTLCSYEPEEPIRWEL